jgi:hypothetical protein
VLVEVAVTRSVAAAGQLADVAEGAGSGHGRLVVLGADLRVSEQRIGDGA